jgi:CRISPR-associated exonuclease Cas4
VVKVMETRWMLALAAGALLAGTLLMWLGRNVRRRRGLGAGQTVSLDRVLLTSHRLGLTGRPDRLIKAEGTIVIEEWKSAHVVRPWHRAQMGVYFLLVEEQLRIRPLHGFLVCGDGTRHRIDNTEKLRAWVLYMAAEIRTLREVPEQPIEVRPHPGQCRPCGMRSHCGQARL